MRSWSVQITGFILTGLVTKGFPFQYIFSLYLNNITSSIWIKTLQYNKYWQIINWVIWQMDFSWWLSAETIWLFLLVICEKKNFLSSLKSLRSYIPILCQLVACLQSDDNLFRIRHYRMTLGLKVRDTALAPWILGL